MSSIDQNILQIQNNVKNICSHCGKCCENEIFYLNDVEAPVIALKLKELGGVNLVRSHIFLNPYEFNIFTKYLFVFDNQCPFHIENRCSIYHDRPMTCQLFPLALGGIFDNTKTELRDPFILPTAGNSSYDCHSQCRSIIAQFNQLSRISPFLGKTASHLIASALLLEKNLAYCFGQPRERGIHFIDTTGMVFADENQVMSFLLQKLSVIYGKTIRKVVDNKEVLTNDEAITLASEKKAKKQTGKTSKRLTRIEKFQPSILEWHDRYFT